MIGSRRSDGTPPFATGPYRARRHRREPTPGSSSKPALSLHVDDTIGAVPGFGIVSRAATLTASAGAPRTTRLRAVDGDTTSSAHTERSAPRSTGLAYLFVNRPVAGAGPYRAGRRVAPAPPRRHSAFDRSSDVIVVGARMATSGHGKRKAPYLFVKPPGGGAVPCSPRSCLYRRVSRRLFEQVASRDTIVVCARFHYQVPFASPDLVARCGKGMCS